MNAEELHPNAQRMLQIMEAWNAGDIERMMSFADEDLTYYAAGQNSVSGTHRGPDEVERVLHRLREMGDTLKAEPLDILADDRYVVFLYRFYGERGTKGLDVTIASASEFGANGKLQRVWFLANDQRSYDEFFG